MKYDLVGVDGNAFCIMAYVTNAMHECGFSKQEQDSYFKNATSGNYVHLVNVSLAMVEKCNEVADKKFYDKL